MCCIMPNPFVQISPALTFPVLFFVTYDFPRDRQVFYQIWLVFVTWMWAIYLIIYMYARFLCRIVVTTDDIYIFTGPCVATMGHTYMCRVQARTFSFSFSTYNFTGPAVLLHTNAFVVYQLHLCHADGGTFRPQAASFSCCMCSRHLLYYVCLLLLRSDCRIEGNAYEVLVFSLSPTTINSFAVRLRVQS